MKYDIVCSTKNLSTEEWLKIRTLGIGGSDAGIIAGCNPYRSIFELWQEKRGEIPVREEESEVIHFGKVLEDVVRKEFIQRTGLMVRKKNSILRSKEYPFMIADLDGVVNEFDGTYSIFEAKTAIEFKNNDEKQTNGIELGKRLRGLYANDNTAIVYVTSYGEYAIDSIKIRPYDYIKKPITYERIVEFFETYYLDQAKRKKVFEYTAHKVKNSIIVSNICYFESQGRTIVIHTITNQYTFYGKLSNLLDNESLSDFISIHKSYLVNKNYIERFTSHSVVLIGIDRVELPISPNKKMEVSEQLLKE